MKKWLLCAVILLLVCGCSNINNMSIDKLINNSINGKKMNANIIRIGYKYYKPAQMSVISTSDNNEILRSNENLYYLYFDTVSYLNKTNNEYEINDISFFSKEITKGDNKGYIEINEIKDNQYLIEIMYNYAKIEVMVDKEYINEAIANSLSILTSIRYNKSAIQSKIKSESLNSYEESVEKFKRKTEETKHLRYVEDKSYDKDVIPDMDLVGN